jgi:hypothetical protein
LHAKSSRGNALGITLPASMRLCAATVLIANSGRPARGKAALNRHIKASARCPLAAAKRQTCVRSELFWF